MIELLPEFIGNHPFLVGAFVVVLFMVVRAEYDQQTNKSSQLTASSAVRLMNDNEKALLLDVRESADFKKGHIKNARHMALSSLAGKLSELESYKDNDIIVYCNSGNMSGRACKMLSKAGFNKVYNLTGGIYNWQESKLPVSKS